MLYIYAMQYQENFINIYPFVSILSEQRKLKMERYVFLSDKARCILGELLLRYNLWKHYDIFTDVHFTYNDYGKPFLLEYKNIFFNISHSDKWVLCGVSDKPIGIDIEKESYVFDDIAKRFFTNEEYFYIKSNPHKDKKEVFYKLWTLKESFVKCIGLGLYRSMKTFRFKFVGNKIIFYNNEKRDNTYSFLNLRIDNEFQVAICVMDQGNELENIKLNFISLDEINKLREEKISRGFL